METIHLICWKYDPTTAVFQRDWALAKGIAGCGIKVECDFVMPGSCQCEKEPNNIHCNYWGEQNANKGKIFAYILSIIKAMFVVGEYKTILSCTLATMCLPLLLINRRNLYLEENEYPMFIQDEKKIHSYIRLILHNFIVKRCAGIFVISNKLREYYKKIGVKSDRVHVINMTVDDSRFIEVEKQIVEPYICYCGTVSNIKDGVDILLESFGIIADEFPNMKLYILGNRPFRNDNERNNAIIEKYGIRKRVYMPGPVSSNDMPQYLTNAKVLVLARPDNRQAAYGFPTKLGEYLMTGNPVVVTKVGELEEFLEHGKSCFFAEPNNAIDFAEKLKWILLHPTEAKEIGANGRKVAKISFNYKIEGEKIVNTVFRVVKR